LASSTKRLDHLVLGHDAHDLALDEEVAALLARGDAEVGVAGLAGAVHDAAHDRDLDGHVERARARSGPRWPP
jgi:hypothetical protein